MNNKFNKQEFPTGNVKQIILQSALNFNQSLFITLVPLRSSASAESALGNITNSLGGRPRVQECRDRVPLSGSVLTPAGTLLVTSVLLET